MRTTRDTLLDGAVSIEQPAPGQGYRVNADAIWLARFAAEVDDDGASVIDLGAGVGAVALTLHALRPLRRLVLVERNPELAELARGNAQRAGLAERCEVVAADVDDWAAASAPTHGCLVVANPPYTPPGSGRRGGNRGRDDARHGSLAPFIRAMHTLISGRSGRACFCYPCSSLVDAFAIADEAGLHAVRLGFVHPTPGRPARIALVELSATAGALAVLAPRFDTDSRGA